MRKDGEALDMVLRWHGGDHTALKRRVKLYAAARSYNPVDWTIWFCWCVSWRALCLTGRSRAC